MQKKIIATAAAPAAIGPYSQAVSANGFLYLSGMLAIDPANGTLVGEDAPSQARQILKNISALLASEGLSIENVIKTTVFLTDLGAFGAVNAVYGETFAKNPPARSCVEVSRPPPPPPPEIECVAVY